MKRPTLFLLSSFILLGTVACDTAKTSFDAPNSPQDQVENPQNVEETREDSQNEVRQDQLDSDIRAREERNDIAGEELERTDGDLSSEVRAKLEANIPEAKLTVTADDGLVNIIGTVPTQKAYETIEPLAREINGVQSVQMDVDVVPPTQS